MSRKKHCHNGKVWLLLLSLRSSTVAASPLPHKGHLLEAINGTSAIESSKNPRASLPVALMVKSCLSYPRTTERCRQSWQMTRPLVILACGYRLSLKREYLPEARARSLVWQAVVDESLLNPYTTGTTSFAWLPLEPNYKHLDLLKTAFNLQF